jgi:2-oxoglutarate dehydrogenase E1 component
VAKSIEERFEESFKYGGNSQYLEQLYEDYIKDPSSLKPEWKKYFDSIQNGKAEISHNSVIESFRNLKLKSTPVANDTDPVTKTSKSSDVQNLINAYRRRGHQVAKIDPLHLREEITIPDLELDFHGL